MKHLHQEFSIRLFRIALAAVSAITFAGVAGAQQKENIGRVQQGLVGGSVVSVEVQEEYGLLTLTTGSKGCSASLLRNNWAITAAHCVDSPDPNRPGQFILAPENSATLTANWKKVQAQQSMRIITFRPVDVAIIRVATPFSVSGSTTRYNRDIFRDGQFPYFGTYIGTPITIFGRGIYQFAQGSGASAVPSQSDGQYRLGFVTFRSEAQDRYWYPNENGQMIAGGDSGGPSFAKVLSGEVLVGVHSLCHSKCLPGQTCGTNSWTWVASTPECADAPIAPVWDEINRYLGAFVTEPEPGLESPPPGFIGTFSKTPANYQPMWVYAIKNDGDLLWYRKDTGESPWQGPKKVGSGWNFKDVIPAGGNSVYALTNDGHLLWYQHQGFNDGTFAWKGPVEVGKGWTFTKIFSGGEGIVYALQADGSLLWYRHGGYANGGGPETWTGPKAVGSGWGQFKDVFSNGQGAIYAVRPNGDLLLYQHNGFATGDANWERERIVSSGWQGVQQINPAARRVLGVSPTKSGGWQNFRQIIPAGGGVILAITEDGKLLWYKHLGLTRSVSFARLKETWEGPVQIGSGWVGFKKVFAFMPVTSAPIVR
jgi:Tachylectin/Trypsin